MLNLGCGIGCCFLFSVVFGDVVDFVRLFLLGFVVSLYLYFYYNIDGNELNVVKDQYQAEYKQGFVLNVLFQDFQYFKIVIYQQANE